MKTDRFLLVEFLTMVLCWSRRECDDSRFFSTIATKHRKAQSVLCLHNMRILGTLRTTDKTVSPKDFFAKLIPFFSNVSDRSYVCLCPKVPWVPIWYFCTGRICVL